LVENSLGRLWLLNRPHSKLAAAMDYYIAPEQTETDFLQLGSPEEIKLADPACGSGHMLTYAFDLLYAIYEEEGYDSVEIPRLILEKNLYGIEIDERAGNLAAFALVMKARAKDRRFFGRKVEPNICVLENVHFSASELDAYKKKVGNDLFTQDLWFLLTQFEQADNFGSLIRPQVKHPEQMLARLEEVGVFSDLLLYSTNEKVKQVLKQAEYLSPRYHVVVANPPYMGSRGMNSELKDYSNDNFPDTKSDLGVMFIERNLDLVSRLGQVGMITLHSWMFLSSFEAYRKKIVTNSSVVSMAHLGSRAFDTIGGEVVSTTAFIIQNESKFEHKGKYLRLVDGSSEKEKQEVFLSVLQAKNPELLYLVSVLEFSKIPGTPFAYWASDKVRNIFYKEKQLDEIAKPALGITTADNNRFVRAWHEVCLMKIGLGYQNRTDAKESRKKWFPYNKGGSYRKWYGNNNYVLNWERDGKELLDFRPTSTIRNMDYYFQQSITWSFVTSSQFGVRYSVPGAIFDVGGSSIFTEAQDIKWITGFLCSKLSTLFMTILNPTLNFQVGNVASLPVIVPNKETTLRLVNKAIEITKADWDAQETSWDFIDFPLLDLNFKTNTISKTYALLRNHWMSTIIKLKELEDENNKEFISAYGLQDELVPDVTLEEITLICNPHHRYGSKKSEEELEALLLTDTMQEFISYAVGCMFGRYSLDKPGLVLANQGEGVDDFRRQLEGSGVTWDDVQFTPDDDNVIPILDGEWFADDIAERFKQFLKVTFGTEHYEENLAFLEEAIGRDIRSYFVKDFYNNHVKMYKKRPIYWLFSSPKGSFNALVYMHRYQPDTVSIILNGYLRQYREKLKAHKSHQEAIARNPGASQGEKTKALKEIEQVDKIQAELKEYEDEVLYPLATQQIAIDLDDGVKANYPRFGDALKKVSGLS
jgi:hypothetical protein